VDLRISDIPGRRKVRTTELSQQASGQVVTVTIDRAEENCDGASAQRNNVVRLVVRNATGAGVTLDGAALPGLGSEAAFQAAPNGWYNAGPNLILAKSGVRGVDARKTFRFSLQPAASAGLSNCRPPAMPG
jgi:alpha-glucosidase